MCRLTSSSPHHPLPVPLEILAKTHFSFQISWILSLFHLFLSILHLSHLYLAVLNAFSPSVLPLPLFLTCCSLGPDFCLSFLAFLSLDFLTTNLLCGHSRWTILEPWKWPIRFHSPFLLSRLRPLYVLYLIFVQRIYIVCVCVNQKQWHLLAVSNQSIGYTDEKNNNRYL